MPKVVRKPHTLNARILLNSQQEFLHRVKHLGLSGAPHGQQYGSFSTWGHLKNPTLRSTRGSGFRVKGRALPKCSIRILSRNTLIALSSQANVWKFAFSSCTSASSRLTKQAKASQVLMHPSKCGSTHWRIFPRNPPKIWHSSARHHHIGACNA